MGKVVTVAPREIHDLVYRCSRVAGCDAGTAHRIAENITFGEIHYGRAVQAFTAALDDGGLPRSMVATAPDAVAAAEVEARTIGTATARFDPPVPFAAIAAAIWHAGSRGAILFALDPDTTGASAVAAVRLGVGMSDAATSAIPARTRDAHRDGVVLDRSFLSQLDQAAAGYLVAETTLDEVSDID